MFTNIEIGELINNINFKKEIIEYLLQSVDINSLNCNEITNLNYLEDIINNNYKIIKNYFGEDYIFVSKKIKDMYIICIIELCNFKNIDYNNLKIYSLKCILSKKSFNGNIFSCRLIKEKNKSIFYINKIYFLFGVKNEFNNLENFDLKKIDIFTISNNSKIIEFKICDFYLKNELDNLLKEENISSLDFINNFKIYRLYINNFDKIGNEIIIFGKLIDTDIVELFTYNKLNNLQRLNIAHIPDIKTSHFINSLQENKLFKFKVKYDRNFNKFIPLNICSDTNDKYTLFEDINTFI